LSTLKSENVPLAVEEATSRSMRLVSPLCAWIASFAHGVVVPIPTFPPSKVAAGPAPACAIASVGYAVEDEAMRPAWNHSGVVVACTTTL